jgi:putative inorganic carbon (HCO3(-)) transporter
MSLQLKPFLSNRSLRLVQHIHTAALYLAALEIWLVGILVAASVVSARLLPWALGVAGLLWIIRYLAYGYLSIRTSADWPIALLALMSLINVWASVLPDVTLWTVYRLLTGIALYYVIVNWVTTTDRLRWLSQLTVIIGLLLALAALISVKWTAEGELFRVFALLYDRLPLLMSDTINPNVMAGALVVLFPCALSLLLFGGSQFSWPQWVLLGAGALLMLGVLILTQSRGGWMGLGASLMIITLLRWRWGKWLILVIAAAGMLVIRWLGVVPVLNALMLNNSLGGLDTRLEVWSRALYMIEDFPITGIGMGLFEEVAGVLYPFFTTSQDVPHAHNLFLQVAVDMGVPGLIAWLAIWMLAILGAWQVYRYGRSMSNRMLTGLGVGLLCGQIALAVHGMVDAVTWGAVRVSVMPWAIWGLTMAAWSVSMKAFQGYQTQNSGERRNGDSGAPAGQAASESLFRGWFAPILKCTPEGTLPANPGASTPERDG